MFQVSHSKMCPGVGNELSKEFAPHLWTEFTESIDVVGARKNRIESAQNISDVLEVKKNAIRSRTNFFFAVGEVILI